MGNSIVISVSATKNVEAGSTVTGTAYVSVRKDSVPCAAITGSLEGLEWISINKSGRLPAQFPNEPKNFTHLPFLVQDFPNGTIPRGQYEYPFQITIPPGAPASMFKTVGSSSCGITYKLVISAMDKGTPVPKFTTSTIITVARSSLQGSKTPMYMAPTSHSLTFGCFNKGNILIGGRVDSSVLVAGYNTCVTFGIVNNSTATIQAFEISIFEDVAIKASGSMPSKVKKIFHKRLNLPRAVLELSPRGQLDDLHELNNVLETGTYKVDIELPLTACSTFHGWRLFVSHKLMITAITAFGMANPVVLQDVIVYNDRHPATHLKSPWDAEHSHSLPSHWQPIVVNTILLPTPVLSKVPLPSRISAPAPSLDVASSFEAFLVTLKASCDPCGELQFYFRSLQTPTVDLSPEQVYLLFQTVSGPLNQLCVADVLAVSLTHITCVLIARALAACRASCRREVAEKFLATGRVMDKEAAYLVMNEVTPFHGVTLEKYLCY